MLLLVINIASLMMSSVYKECDTWTISSCSFSVSVSCQLGLHVYQETNSFLQMSWKTQYREFKLNSIAGPNIVLTLFRHLVVKYYSQNISGDDVRWINSRTSCIFNYWVYEPLNAFLYFLYRQLNSKILTTTNIKPILILNLHQPQIWTQAVIKVPVPFQVDHQISRHPQIQAQQNLVVV